MKKTIIFVTFALIGAIIGGCSSQPKSADDSLTDGKQYLEQLNFIKAEEAFAGVRAADSLSVINDYNSGLVFEYKLLYLDALDKYLSVIDSEPGVEQAYEGAYNCFMKLGSFEDALGIAYEYNQLTNNNRVSEIMVAEALLANGVLGETRKNLNQVTELSNSGLLCFINSRLFLAEGNSDSANYYYNHGLSLSEKSPRYYNFAADYLVALGLYDSAVVVSQMAADLNPDNLFYQIPHYERLVELGYMDQARKVLNSLEEKNIDPYVTLWLEMELGFKNVDYYLLRERIMDYFRLDRNLYTVILRALEVRGYLIEELLTGQNYISLTNSTSPTNNSFRFIEYINFYAAIRFSELENSTRTRDNLLKIEQEETRSGSRAFLLRALTNNYKVGLFEDAIATAGDFERDHADNIVWLSELGKFYTDEAIRKYSKASQILAEALKFSPTSTVSFMKLLEGFEVQNKYQDALAQYDNFPLFDNQNNFTAFYKGKLYLLNNEFDKFKAQFEQYYSANKGNTILLNSMSDILIVRGDVKEINFFIDQLKPFSDDSPDVLAMIGELLIRSGEYYSAKDYIEQAKKLEPDNANICVLSAMVEFYTGSKDDAYKMFEENLKTFPNFPDNKYYYSKLLADEGREFPKASNLARGAVFETRDQVKYAVNLSYVYYKMGRYDLASGEASKATKLKGDKKLVYYWLGMSWSQLSNREGYHIKAKDAFNKAIELGLSGEELNQAKRILKTL